VRLTLACAAALLLAACCHEPPREGPAGELHSGGRPVTAALAPGEVHRYRLPLKQGYLLRLVVDQQGVDAVVALEDPTGALVLEADRPVADRGAELVLAVADRSGDYSLVVRGPEKGSPGRYTARIEALIPATEADRRSAEAYRSFTGARRQGDDEAMKSRARALATWRKLGQVELEGEALERIGTQLFIRRDYPSAAERYHEAAAAFARAGNRRWEAIARNELGSSLLPQGATQEAADQYTLALALARQVEDRINTAKALHGLGQAFQNQGEPQRALDRYREALDLWPKDEPLRTNTLHQFGVLYARYLHDEHHGGELLLEALDAWGPGQEGPKASTLSQLGRLADGQGRLDEARRYYEQALELRRKIDRCGSAVFLARLALVEEKQGARAAADARRAEALRFVTTTDCPRSEPTVHLLGADLAEMRGESARALTGYRHAEQLFAGLGDRMLVAESLAGIARNERLLGDRQAARAAGRRALDIVEGVRPTVLSDDLRTSLFSGAREAFDFQIDLLLDLGATEEAWATAEESRARVLQDLLAAAAGDGRGGAASLQGARERALQRQLNALESQRLRASEARPETLLSLRQAIDAKIEELETLRGELHRTGSRGTSLAHPEPVTLAAVRRELLDGDTVLLEYRLGETASTVWVVTRDAFSAVRLPPRSTIEPAAREAARWLKSLEWPGHNPSALCNLSQMLLAPAVQHLDRRRLVVVADGALEALPFAALPFPADAAGCPEAPLLVDTHEIVSLPSVATLLTRRRLLAGRRPAAGWLAVVADPAYGSAHRLLRGSAQEAAALVAQRPAGKVFRATGATASRQIVTGGALRGFRILHFATHGIFAEQPQLSALDLADRDAAGRPVPGTLYAHEIYGLDLPAELVVLSACETARGREVPGEGLVSGLPRAFLHAGAARVLVSLWEVEDQCTRDLMVLFYRGLLDRNLPPAQALQEAQRTLRQAGRRPNQWAGFVLLGDWRPLPPFSALR